LDHGYWLILDLGQIKLTGEFPELDLMSKLKVLRAGANFLYGQIPEGLFEMIMHLEEIDLSRNGFTGFVHSINSTNLKLLNLSLNSYQIHCLILLEAVRQWI